MAVEALNTPYRNELRKFRIFGAGMILTRYYSFKLVILSKVEGIVRNPMRDQTGHEKTSVISLP